MFGKLLFIAAALCASGASAKNYSEKSDCMAELSKTIFTSDAFSNQREVRSHQFKTVPDFGSENVENIVDAFEKIERAWAVIAEELLLLCSQYPSE
ncbi:hypothetical protein [Sulfitobacter sp. M22]|uniref:hypothetical protein n=1 Tax=Sulfitobacter sp. M22 TaxID=2675332 RepID=UPI001F2C5F74|nr:hypothetical protein [Sulfitobacter sp. M22]MCF7725782.1 hypothetical protein [Sulfitobacter sp. M22]